MLKNKTYAGPVHCSAACCNLRVQRLYNCSSLCSNAHTNTPSAQAPARPYMTNRTAHAATCAARRQQLQPSAAAAASAHTSPLLPALKYAQMPAHAGPVLQHSSQHLPRAAINRLLSAAARPHWADHCPLHLHRRQPASLAAVFAPALAAAVARPHLLPLR